jgi:signal transduction histidine kinase
MATFTVDTQLFRELGELLVGRDATALSELIKNAYDADATRVQIFGTELGEGFDGSIVVSDNGTGMTGAQFRSGYLTIAGRGKEEGDRRSPVYRRRFTGEKGIGRLATHKLAHGLRVRSIAAHGGKGEGSRRVNARIDWDAIESYATLADIGADALAVNERRLRSRHPSGTQIELQRLRHSWSDEDLRDFVVELNAFEPPRLLTGPLPDGLLAAKGLFRELPVRDAEDVAGFEVELLGDFDRSEDFWRQVADTASWVVEIESNSRRVVVSVSPTSRTLGRTSEAEGHVVEYRPEHDGPQPEFTARILARENARGTRRTRDFVSKIAGVRVYMEGFRVPPYGESGNDWLSIDRAYARRAEKLNLDIPGLPVAPAGGREGLRGLPNNAYVGAILLTRRGASDLDMLINREGFVPSGQLDAIRATVSTALNILTRVRAQVGVAEGAPDRRDVTLLSSELRVRDGLLAASEQARALRTRIADVGAGALDGDITQLSEDLDELGELATSAVRDRSLLRVLASVGTQMAAFVHETQGLVGAAQGVSSALRLLAERHPERGRDLRELGDAVDGVASRIDSQARYLSETTAVATRRRRQRLCVAERFAAAAALVTPVATRLGIVIENRIDEQLRTAPMYPAELTVIFSNLITNAVKAAGEGGRIRGRSLRVDDRERGIVILIENTGAAAESETGERWFAPFASTTVDALDPILGQGMGLGLPITRSIVEDYRGGIRFVTPTKRFATALELRLP